MMRLVSALVISALLIGLVVAVAVASPYMSSYIGTSADMPGSAGDGGNGPSAGDQSESGDGSGGSDGDAADTTIAIEDVWESTHISFGYDELTYLVVQSEEEWLVLWGRASGFDGAPPSVDFRTHTVIAAILGMKPTLGYAIRIEGVVLDENGDYVVSVIIVSPGADCLVGQALTYPVHMVSIPKSEGPFQFVFEFETVGCG
ncbi:MAG: protease complex subunit PrcB family protein [Anaerolineae bacterium]|nr:protease complex subunit PrcB family protein [Anaerolineae bacterium]NIN97847.1 protease complex subunit PrcB family protein [Anaerolineae bacterium]